MRYGSCNDTLEAQCGAIGVSKISNLRQCHALKIRQATMGILSRFCVPNCKMPFGKKERNFSFNYKLFADSISISTVFGIIHLPVFHSSDRPYLAKDRLWENDAALDRQG